jgi:hypothetical protein
MKELKEGDAVYVRRGPFLEAAKVDHTYVGGTGVDCVRFTVGVDALRVDVITYDEYWERQRAALRDKV